MSNTSVVYLLWAPLGSGHVKRFIEAYQTLNAGADHELVIAACGGGEDVPLEPLLELFDPLRPHVERFVGRRIDLRTYRETVDSRPDSEMFLFMNSFSRPLAANWLRYVVDTLQQDDVGPVGPVGSYESFVANRRKPFGVWHLARHPLFPNPHIRTSCFALTRESIEMVTWPDIRTKAQAWRFECGRKNLTRQLKAFGRRPLVVGRDGNTYEADQWYESDTFRAGGQRNLLIGDLRTDDYENADLEGRALLSRLAWRR